MNRNQYSQLLGRTLKLHVYLRDLRNYNVRHRNFRLSISPADPDNQIDSTFTVVPALNNKAGVSFQSKNYPDHFIRHRSGECFLEVPGDDPNSRADFSWEPQEGLDTSDSDGKIPISFSSNGWFMRHEDYDLNVQKESIDSEFKKVATWLVDPKRPGEGTQASGEWKLVAAYDGKTDWKLDKAITVGIKIDKAKSQTESSTTAWKVSRESEMSQFGATAKMAFELSGQQSISNMISTAISQSKSETTTQEYSGGPSKGNAEPTWIWQWVLRANIPSMGTFDAFLPLTSTTYTDTPPPNPSQF